MMNDALMKPLGKRAKTIFTPRGKVIETGLRKCRDAATMERWRLQANLRQAAENAARAAPDEIIEHIPCERVYVSPERAAALQERPSVSHRIVRRHHETGEIIAAGRMVRELVGGRYESRWIDEALS